jgi:hypothetical protein
VLVEDTSSVERLEVRSGLVPDAAETGTASDATVSGRELTAAEPGIASDTSVVEISDTKPVFEPSADEAGIGTTTKEGGKAGWSGTWTGNSGISWGSQTNEPGGAPKGKPVISSSKSGNGSKADQSPNENSGGDALRRLIGERKVTSSSPSACKPDSSRADRIGKTAGRKIASWR